MNYDSVQKILESPADIGRLEKSVRTTLQEFLLGTHDTKNLSPQDWFRFYLFIIAAYKRESLARPRVSELARILKKWQMDEAGKMATLYAHALYILACYEGEKIYGKDGFNP